MLYNDDNLADENELKQLLHEGDSICLSMFMPTHRVRSGEQREDPIRLKNLIGEAELQMAAFAPDLTVPEVQHLLEPATRLINDGLFWNEQLDGLGIFLSESFNRIYRLPLDFKKTVRVANRFYIRPLLPLLARNDRFYILALSQNKLRLFKATRDYIDEVGLENIPTSLDEAIFLDDPERQLQFHTSTGSSAGPGGRAAAYHGHNIRDEKKTNILRYFQKVDAGLRDILREAEFPLVLAGVEYLFPIYQEANTYPHLVNEGIPGNPENALPTTLQGQAWEILQPYFLQGQQDAARQYGYFANQGRAAGDLKTIAKAARAGRIAVLFVPRQPLPDIEAEELVDSVAKQTLLHGGDIHVLALDDIPGDGTIAAIFRY